MTYTDFLARKTQYADGHGFDPLWMPDFLFDFQAFLNEWALRRGRSAVFADCGLGKTPLQLVWAENVVRKTNKPVLVLTPLAVSQQTIKESDKFGIEAKRSRDGKHDGRGIWVTNYEQLKHFDSDDFVGMVCDESSILKSFNGATKAAITEFMRRLPYRLLCTATAAPNDYFELGTSSEALGELGFRDMITAFFKQETNTEQRGWGRTKYRFKGHAQQPFWRWVCSWARACRRPSDLGFSDDGFDLPELIEKETVVKCERARKGMLFPMAARNMQEEREERRMTLRERCEHVAELVSHDDPAVCWCQLNDEADLLEKLIPDALQVSGSMSDDKKEERLEAFARGELNKIVIKPKIGSFGLNWQHCNHVTTFPGHSFEQYYQSVRRCWRFGQERPVTVDIVTTEGEIGVLKNLKRKSEQCSVMFDSLVKYMNDQLRITSDERFHEQEQVPSWL